MRMICWGVDENVTWFRVKRLNVHNNYKWVRKFEIIKYIGNLRTFIKVQRRNLKIEGLIRSINQR